MIEKVREKIYEVKDFPKPGIGFKDITPVVQDAACFKYVVDEMTAWAEKK